MLFTACWTPLLKAAAFLAGVASADSTARVVESIFCVMSTTELVISFTLSSSALTSSTVVPTLPIRGTISRSRSDTILSTLASALAALTSRYARPMATTTRKKAKA